MASITDLTIRIGASVANLKAGLNKAEKLMKRSARKFERIGSDLTTKLSVPLGGIGAAALKAAGDFEVLENGLTAVIGDAEAARKEIKLLQQAAQNPGLSFEQAVKGSIRLQAVDFNAEQARETMLQFGNAIATVGGTAEDLDAVTTQITQMVSKNRILQEDFGVLQERVPLISKALESAFGTKNIDNIRKTGISSQEFIGRIVTELSKLERVDGGINNAFVNLGNSAKSALATIGREINKTLNVQKNLERLGNFLQRVADKFAALQPSTKKFIIIAGTVAAAIGPVLLGIGTLIQLLPVLGAAFTALTGPVGITIAALGALTLGFVKAYKENDLFRAKVDGTVAALKEFVIIIKEIVDRYVGGLTKVFSGDVKGGILDLGKVFIDSNPISLFTKGGKRMADAFSDGFKESLVTKVKDATTSAAETISQSTANIFSGFTANAAGGGSGDVTADRTSTPILEPLETISLPTSISSQSLVDPLKEALPQIKLVESAFGNLGQQLDMIATKNSLFGESQNTIAQQMEAVKAQINKSIEEGWSPMSNEVQILTKKLEDLKKQQFESLSVFEKFDELLANMANGPAKTLAQAMDGAARAMDAAARSGETSFKKLGQAALKGAADVLRAAIIKSVSEVAAKAFAQLGIFGLPLAAGAGALVGGLFNRLISQIGIPALAKGGIVDKPTLALIGEAGPEAVVPLSKMGQFGGGAHIAEARISGNDLLILLKRAEMDRNRIR